VKTAVDGVPGTTVAVPTATPSTVKVTVPDGGEELGLLDETVAVTCSELPGAGVVVAGVSTSVVEALATISVTEAATELLKFESPLYEACSVCVPVVSPVIVIVAVVPDTTFWTPCVTPSSVNVTVPVGRVELGYVTPRVAVTCNELPAEGVVVAGVTTSVVGVFATVMVTEFEFALL